MRRLLLPLAFVLACSSPAAPPDAGTPPGIPDGDVRAVLLLDGHPVAHARLALVGSPVVTASDASGRVVLRGVPAGRWTFAATAENAALSLSRTLPAGKDGLAQGTDLGALALGAFGSIRGSVLRDGAAVAGAQVALVGTGLVPTTDGAYEFGSVPPGPYELRAVVEVDGATQVSGPVETTVNPGAEDVVDLDLTTLKTFTRGAIAGHAVRAGNAPIEITLHGTDSTLHLETPGDDGNFEAAELPAGVYGLLAHSSSTSVTLPAVPVGGTFDVGTLWLPATSCEGGAQDADLDGVPDDDEPASCRCDPRGTVDVDDDGLCDDVDPFVDTDERDGGTADGGRADDAGTPDAGSADAGTPDAGPTGPIDVSPAGAWGLCAPSGWCWEHPLATGDVLWGVTGTADDDLWMMVGNTTLAHWNGTRLFRVPTPLEAAGESTAALFARTTNDAWMVGRSGTVARWNGSTWNVVGTFTAPTDNSYPFSVWAADASNAWIVAGTQILHWDGAALVDEVNPAGVVASVHGTSADDVWIAGWDAILQRQNGAWVVRTDAPAIDTSNEVLWGAFAVGGHAFFGGSRGVPASEGLVLHWDGSAWTRTETGPGVLNGGITGSAADDVWFGNLHWDGTSFEHRRPPSGAESFLDLASGDVLAAGWRGTIERWTGAAWTQVAGPPPIFEIDALWARTATDAWAVGWNLVEHWDGTRWSIAFDPGEALPNVWGSAANDVWAGLWHFDGARWGKVSAPPSLASTPPVVGGRAADDAWFTNASVTLHWNGTTFEPPPSLPANASQPFFTKNTAWNAIGKLWVVVRGTGLPGDGGVFAWDGQAWTKTAPFPADAAPLAAFGTGPDDTWISFDGGALWHFSASAWSEVARPSGADVFTSLWGSAPDDVFATDGLGVYRWSGQDWQLATKAAEPYRVRFVTGAAAGEVWAAGSEALRLSGGAWTSTYAHANEFSGVDGMWMFDDGDGWAVGDQHLVLRRGATGWAAVAIPPDAGTRAVFAAAPDDAWVVGYPPFAHWNGTAFALVAPPDDGNGTRYTAVWGSAANDVWTVGTWGAIQHWDGQSWNFRATGYTGHADWQAIDGLDANDVWIAGYGEIAHWNGATWVNEPLAPEAEGVELWDVSVVRDGSAILGFAVGDSDLVLRRVVDTSGAHWERVDFPNTGALGLYPEAILSVVVVSPTEAWLATAGRGEHFVFGWDGTDWTPATFPSASAPRVLAKTASGKVFAGGADGGIFRLVR